MQFDEAKVVYDEVQQILSVVLPMTKPTGKVRIKNRTFFGEYGEPVAARTTPISLNSYIEWQIGYDLLNNAENRGKTSLMDYPFVNYKGEKKLAYELSEILFYAHKMKLIAQQDIKNLAAEIGQVESKNLLDTIDVMRISRTNPIETNVNGVNFYEMKVSYPMLVHKFRQYDIYVEIISREKQRAVGVQPMLYVCLPVNNLRFDLMEGHGTSPVGRTLNKNECAEWFIGKPEAELALEIFRLFGMLSEKHRFDVLAIMKALFDID